MFNSRIDPPVKRIDLHHADFPGFLELAETWKRNYVNNTPFDHVVIDNLFPDDVLTAILNEIAVMKHDSKKDLQTSRNKFHTSNLGSMGMATSRFLTDLNSAPFCQFLETVTGIEGIIPDPHFLGGGVHEITRGGFLKIHADFNWHDKLKLDRRLNLLLYLNKDWQEEWGGHLQLFDESLQNSKKVAPIFNRTVIFSTTDSSFHGHPEPLECPEDRSRISLALYYYSNGRPAAEVKSHQQTKTTYLPSI